MFESGITLQSTTTVWLICSQINITHCLPLAWPRPPSVALFSSFHHDVVDSERIPAPDLTMMVIFPVAGVLLFWCANTTCWPVWG